MQRQILHHFREIAAKEEDASGEDQYKLGVKQIFSSPLNTWVEFTAEDTVELLREEPILRRHDQEHKVVKEEGE